MEFTRLLRAVPGGVVDALQVWGMGVPVVQITFSPDGAAPSLVVDEPWSRDLQQRLWGVLAATHVRPLGAYQVRTPDLSRS